MLLKMLKLGLLDTIAESMYPRGAVAIFVLRRAPIGTRKKIANNSSIYFHRISMVFLDTCLSIPYSSFSKKPS